MAEKANVNKNTIFNTLKSLFGVIYPLITFPYISRVLMAENVGKVNFGNSVVGYFSLVASLGVTTYAVRECAKYRDDEKKLGETASQILSINMVSTLIAYLALAVTLVFARSLDNYRVLIIIQSSTILFTTLGADWLNTAMEDFQFIAIRTVSMQVLSLVLMFVFVHRPEHYIVYAVISVVASSGANVINIFYRRKYCRTSFTFKMDIKKHLPPIMMLFSLVLSQTIFVNSDITILGLVKGDFEVGLYSTSVKIYNIVNNVIASIAWVVMPQLSEAFAKKDYAKVNELLKYSLNFILVFGLPCLVGLNVVAKEAICLVAGEEYLGAALSLKILVAALGCSFIAGWIGNMMMLPSGREKVYLKASVSAAVVNLVLNLILIPKWGLNAAAATTLISHFLSVIVMVPYVEKEIKVDGIVKILIGPGVGCCFIAVVGFIVKYFVSSYYLIAVLTIVISVIVYVAVLIAFRNQFFMGFAEPFLKKIKRG